MEKHCFQSILRLFLYSGLILALVQFNTIPVSGVEDSPEEQFSEIHRETETETCEETAALTSPSPEPIIEAVPTTSPETFPEPASTETTDPGALNINVSKNTLIKPITEKLLTKLMPGIK